MNAILIKYNQRNRTNNQTNNHNINAAIVSGRPAPVSNSRVLAAKAILDQIKRMH